MEKKGFGAKKKTRKRVKFATHHMVRQYYRSYKTEVSKTQTALQIQVQPSNTTTFQDNVDSGKPEPQLRSIFKRKKHPLSGTNLGLLLSRVYLGLLLFVRGFNTFDAYF